MVKGKNKSKSQSVEVEPIVIDADDKQADGEEEVEKEDDDDEDGEPEEEYDVEAILDHRTVNVSEAWREMSMLMDMSLRYIESDQLTACLLAMTELPIFSPHGPSYQQGRITCKFHYCRVLVALNVIVFQIS
jgi:hypothetical protein